MSVNADGPDFRRNGISNGKEDAARSDEDAVENVRIVSWNGAAFVLVWCVAVVTLCTDTHNE
jgi:hypothetical protein